MPTNKLSPVDAIEVLAKLASSRDKQETAKGKTAGSAKTTGIKKKPAAASKSGRVLKKPSKALEKADTSKGWMYGLGCSKCKACPNGCPQCKKHTFKGKRYSSRKQLGL